MACTSGGAGRALAAPEGCLAGRVRSSAIPRRGRGSGRASQTRRDLACPPVAFMRARPGAATLIGLQVGSTMFRGALISLPFLRLPVTLLGGFVKRQIWFACFLVPICYTAAVVALLAWVDGRFTEPVYVFHLVNVTVGVVAAWRPVVRRWPRLAARWILCATRHKLLWL